MRTVQVVKTDVTTYTPKTDILLRPEVIFYVICNIRQKFYNLYKKIKALNKFLCRST